MEEFRHLGLILTSYGRDDIMSKNNSEGNVQLVICWSGCFHFHHWRKNAILKIGLLPNILAIAFLSILVHIIHETLARIIEKIVIAKRIWCYWEFIAGNNRE